MAYELRDRQIDAEKVWFKAPTIPPEVLAYEEPVDVNELMSGVTLARLNDIFQSIIKKQADKIDPVRSKFGRIEKEEVSLSDKMTYVEESASRTFFVSESFRSTVRENGSGCDISGNIRADEDGKDRCFPGIHV